MTQGNQDPFVVSVAVLESTVSVESISTPLGNGPVELLLLECLPLEQRSTSAHIAGVSHQNNLPLCSRHTQALSVGHSVLELVKPLLFLRAPAPGSSLLDEVRHDGAGVGEILDVAAVEVASPNETAYIMESFLGFFISYLSVHQGFGLRGGCIANVEPQVLHRLLHELTLLQLESSVVLLADCKELAQED